MTKAITDEPDQSRVILTNCIHSEPYNLDDGYSLRAIKATDEMLVGYMQAGASFYWALMALPYFDVSSYNVYRDLVIFHSFVSEYPQTYQHAEESHNHKVSYYDSDLTFLDPPLHPIPFAPDLADFSRFPIVAWNPSRSEYCLTEAEIERMHSVGFLAKQEEPELHREIDYRSAFRLFRRLKSGPKRQRALYDHVGLYVFASSIWQMLDVYRNDAAAAMFYLSILDSSLGEPPQCKQSWCCPKCGREFAQHDKEKSRGAYFAERHEAELGQIETLRNTRHKFAHGGYRREIADELCDIYDRFEIGAAREDDWSHEREAFDFDECLDALRLLARKTLVEAFLERYDSGPD